MERIKISKWYKSPEGLFYILGHNENENNGNQLYYLMEWIIDGEFITTDGIYRSLPEEGIKEATHREIWNAMKQVNEGLIKYKKKYLEVTHYVSKVQHALNFSNIEPQKQIVHESIH